MLELPFPIKACPAAPRAVRVRTTRRRRPACMVSKESAAEFQAASPRPQARLCGHSAHVCCVSRRCHRSLVGDCLGQSANQAFGLSVNSQRRMRRRNTSVSIAPLVPKMWSSQEMTVVGLFLQHLQQRVTVVGFRDIHAEVQVRDRPVLEAHVDLMVVGMIEVGHDVGRVIE